MFCEEKKIKYVIKSHHKKFTGIDIFPLEVFHLNGGFIFFFLITSNFLHHKIITGFYYPSYINRFADFASESLYPCYFKKEQY